MKVIGNLVAKNGTYTNRDGEEKANWLTIGKLFQKDDGTYSAKVDSFPIGGEWDGWLSVFPPRDKEDKPRGQGQARGGSRTSQLPPFEPDSDIPF